MPFKDHGLMLYLDKTLLIRFNQLKADKTLGRSFAGLLAFVEGMHTMGFLDKDEYERYKKRYSVPLDAEPQQVRLEETKQIQERKKLAKMFTDVREQWKLHEDPKWRRTWVQKAREHGELDEAKQLLAFVEEHRS